MAKKNLKQKFLLSDTSSHLSDNYLHDSAPATTSVMGFDQHPEQYDDSGHDSLIEVTSPVASSVDSGRDSCFEVDPDVRDLRDTDASEPNHTITSDSSATPAEQQPKSAPKLTNETSKPFNGSPIREYTSRLVLKITSSVQGSSSPNINQAASPSSQEALNASATSLAMDNSPSPDKYGVKGITSSFRSPVKASRPRKDRFIGIPEKESPSKSLPSPQRDPPPLLLPYSKDTDVALSETSNYSTPYRSPPSKQLPPPPPLVPFISSDKKSVSQVDQFLDEVHNRLSIIQVEGKEVVSGGCDSPPNLAICSVDEDHRQNMYDVSYSEPTSPKPISISQGDNNEDGTFENGISIADDMDSEETEIDVCGSPGSPVYEEKLGDGNEQFNYVDNEGSRDQADGDEMDDEEVGDVQIKGDPIRTVNIYKTDKKSRNWKAFVIRLVAADYCDDDEETEVEDQIDSDEELRPGSADTHSIKSLSTEVDVQPLWVGNGRRAKIMTTQIEVVREEEEEDDDQGSADFATHDVEDVDIAMDLPSDDDYDLEYGDGGDFGMSHAVVDKRRSRQISGYQSRPSTRQSCDRNTPEERLELLQSSKAIPRFNSRRDSLKSVESNSSSVNENCFESSSRSSLSTLEDGDNSVAAKLARWLNQFALLNDAPDPFEGIPLYILEPYNRKCETCHKTFNHQSTYICHKPCYYSKRLNMNTNSNYLDPVESIKHQFDCPSCLVSFNEIGHLARHLKSHMEKQYICNVDKCDKKSATKNVADKHAYHHTGYRRYMCGWPIDKSDGQPLSGLEFIQEGWMAVLKQKVGKDGNPVPDEDWRVARDMICGHQLTSSAGVRDHIMSIHLELRPFTCELCSKSLLSSNSLEKHLRSRHGQGAPLMACLVEGCQSRFLNNYARKVHISKCHPEVEYTEDDHEALKRDVEQKRGICGKLVINEEGDVEMAEEPILNKEEAEKYLDKFRTVKKAAKSRASEKSFEVADDQEVDNRSIMSRSTRRCSSVASGSIFVPGSRSVSPAPRERSLSSAMEEMLTRPVTEWPLSPDGESGDSDEDGAFFCSPSKSVNGRTSLPVARKRKQLVVEHDSLDPHVRESIKLDVYREIFGPDIFASPRKKVRSRKQRSYTHQEMLEAIEDVEFNGVPYREACYRSSIPLPSFRKKMKQFKLSYQTAVSHYYKKRAAAKHVTNHRPSSFPMSKTKTTFRKSMPRSKM